MAPEGCGDELEEGQDAGGAWGWGRGGKPVEEEVEEAEAEGVALVGESGGIVGCRG